MVKRRRTPPSYWGVQRATQGRAGGSTRSQAAPSSPRMTPPASSWAAAGTPEQPVSGTRTAAALRIPPVPTQPTAAPDLRRRNVVAYPFIIYYSIRSNIEEEEGSGFFRKVLRKMLIIFLRDMGSDIWVVGGVTCWLVATHFSETWHSFNWCRRRTWRREGRGWR